MKKQFTVTAILICLYAAAFAQGAEVCTGTTYTIANTVEATTGSTYRWTENGNIISGAVAATYTVPNNKVVGVYTYVRQSKSSDCPDWQSSNEFTVTVFACTVSAGTATGSTATITDARDGKAYKVVRMPDGKLWFAQNLNYTQDLTFNMYAAQANGKIIPSASNGVPAIASYWCPGLSGSTYSGDQNTCNIYGALYTWETAMMVDGKYADESKISSVWDESWVSGNYYALGAPGLTPNAKINNARGERGICPKGWTIPTDYDWANMLDHVEGNTTYTISQTVRGLWGTSAGLQLKSTATYTVTDPVDGSWLNDDASIGLDDAGFNATPAGLKRRGVLGFFKRGESALWWTSSVTGALNAWLRTIDFNQGGVYMDYNYRNYGFCVRCIKE